MQIGAFCQGWGRGSSGWCEVARVSVAGMHGAVGDCRVSISVTG